MTARSSLFGALVATVAIAGLPPAIGLAQAIPKGQQIIMPTPAPMPTQGGTPLPYPAYGSPAPDVAHLKQRKGVPAVVSLQQAVKIAVALSPVFAAQNAQWAAIHAKYTSEKQALFPAISGSGTIGNQYTNSSATTSRSGTVLPTPSSGPASLSGSSTVASESLSITIQQLIYDGGRTIAAIHSAKSADYAGRATLLRSLQTLSLNVANAYYAVLQNNATVVADAQLVKEFEVNELSVTAQIRNGAAARSDLAAAQFQTAQARGNLVTAQGQAIGAQATFATTLGLDADTQAVPQQLGTQPQVPNPSYETSVKRAMLLRPDFIAAQYTVESDKEGLRYAKLARFPILTAGASDQVGRSFGPLAQLSNNSTSSFDNVKTLGLSLTIPIYDQGLTNYNVAVAAATLDSANDSLRQTGLQVQSDVRSALANLISARALLVQTNAELTAARVSLDATQAQYRVGATTIINVVTAEANLSTAQADQIQSLYGVQTAQQNYLYATGTSDLQL
ncbi:MAG TPA: TolC family protein [Candidatus Tumulicola sp.]|jgi:outer membrane protein